MLYTPKEMAVFLRRCGNGVCNDSCVCADVGTKCDAALMRMAAEVLEAVPSWIGVDERKPDQELEEVSEEYGLDNVEVIVVVEGANISTVLKYDGEGFKDEYGDPYRVVKWMPMPSI